MRNEFFIAGTVPTPEDNLWKMYKVYVGSKTLQLAGPYCPPETTVDRPFLVLPSEYQAWAAKQQPPHWPTHERCQLRSAHAHAHAPPRSSPPRRCPAWAPPLPALPGFTVPVPPEQDDFPGALAQITSPRPGAAVAGVVSITGSASASAFGHYILEWGGGRSRSMAGPRLAASRISRWSTGYWAPGTPAAWPRGPTCCA